jgi:hypothetical protein
MTEEISTSYIERQNLSLRMASRPVYAADERFLKEVASACRRRRLVRRALQSVSGP